MKKLILCIALFAIGSQLFAQNTETLFSRKNILGIFGGPIVEASQIKNELSFATGGGGGIIVDNFFFGGYGLANTSVLTDITEENPPRLDIAHGGFWLGYNYKSHKLAHIFASAKLGWGAVDVELDDDYEPFPSGPGNSYRTNFDNVFVVSPELGVEVNIFKWFRIAATGGYRYVDGVNPAIHADVNKTDYNSFTGALTFRFGWFGKARTTDVSELEINEDFN